MSASTAFAELEARIKDAVSDLHTDEKADLRGALSDAKAEVGKLKADAERDAGQVKAEVLGQVQPLLTSFEGALKVAVEAAEPGVQTTVAGLVAKLLEDAAKIVGVASL